MHMEYYQIVAAKTAVYPNSGEEGGLIYAVLGLGNEAGELQGKLKKVLRGDRTLEEAKPDLLAELGDVLWYVAAIATELDEDLASIAQLNLDKLALRQQSNTIRGDGDNR